jgi:hypothetical protein
MSDNYKKDKLEDLFKGSFDDLPETPAENGWDLPSDGVWSRVDANLRPGGRRRGGLVWWMLGLGLMIIIGWAIFWTTQQEHFDPAEIEHKLEIVESTNTKGLENDNNEEINAEVDLKEEEYLNKSSKLAEEEVVVIDKAVPVESAEILSSKIQLKNEDTGISERSQRTVTTDVSEQRQRPVNNESKTADIPSGQESKGQLNDNRLVNKQLDQDAEGALVKTRQKGEEKRIVPDTDTISLKPKIAPGRLLQQLPLKLQVLTYESTEKLPGVTYEANDFITPTVSKADGLYLGVEASVLESYRTILAKRDFVVPRFYEDEKPDISLGYGINVGYQFSRNWSIESGLNYTSTALAFRARRQIRYTMVDEQPAGGGDFQSDYKLPFETSNGTIESDVAVARSAGTQVVENEFIALSLRGAQNFSYLNVPILARYHFGKGRWQMGLKGGVVNRILLDASFQFTSISTARQGLRVVVNDRFYQKRTLNKVNDYQIDFELGAGLRFLATEQLWIYAEPTYRRSINPSHESINFKTFPTVKAIEVGMGWRF